MVLLGPKETLDNKDPREYKVLKVELGYKEKKVILSKLISPELYGFVEKNTKSGLLQTVIQLIVHKYS